MPDATTPRTLATTCCVVGGGPAGMVLGYLLARRGIRVTVLEKHADFFRDFRGDTVHPSTLEIFYQLGMLDEFLKLPHQKLHKVSGMFGDVPFRAADFRHVPTHCKFVVLMPQWDFLNFLSRQAQKFPEFDLRMQHGVTNLTRDGERITGVEVETPDGMLRIEADLVVACDGRQSHLRQSAGLEVLETGVPVDVLWFRIDRQPSDPEQLFGIVNYGRALVLINRDTYFQAGLIIEKGAFARLQAEGLPAFRESIRTMAPYLGDRVEELRDWAQINLLTVRINHLRQWYRPGLLFIGDAAHAMSPAGGVGINLAIQDAVATANLLTRPLRDRCLQPGHLRLVQQRREFPTRVTQFLQLNAHRAFAQVFHHPGPLRAPWQLKLAVRLPGVQRLMGRIVGMGIRPERIADVPARPPAPAAKVRVAAVCAAAFAVAAVCLWRKTRAV